MWPLLQSFPATLIAGRQGEAGKTSPTFPFNFHVLPQLQHPPAGPPMQVGVSQVRVLPELLRVSLMHTQMAQSTAVYDEIIRTAVRLPDGQVAYKCPHHGFIVGDAVATPRHGDCEACWILFYMKVVACTPPEERERLFEGLGGVLQEANRLTERGDWDVQWTPPQTSELDPADIIITDRPAKET